MSSEIIPNSIISFISAQLTQILGVLITTGKPAKWRPELNGENGNANTGSRNRVMSRLSARFPVLKWRSRPLAKLLNHSIITTLIPIHYEVWRRLKWIIFKLKNYLLIHRNEKGYGMRFRNGKNLPSRPTVKWQRIFLPRPGRFEYVIFNDDLSYTLHHISKYISKIRPHCFFFN